MSQDIDSRISELPEALTILPGDLVPIVQQGVNKRAVASLFVAGGDSGSGWSPLFAVASDGARRVLQITDWTGGTGTKPAVGYLGPSGIVQNIAQGVDIGVAGLPEGGEPGQVLGIDEDGNTAWVDMLPGNATPPPPTNGIVNDLADTFAFTTSSGFPSLSDHEFRINGGAWTTVTTNPISIGNVDVAVGQLQMRVKAATGRNVSSILSNQTAFVVALGPAPQLLSAVIEDSDKDEVVLTYDVALKTSVHPVASDFSLSGVSPIVMGSKPSRKTATTSVSLHKNGKSSGNGVVRPKFPVPGNPDFGITGSGHFVFVNINNQSKVRQKGLIKQVRFYLDAIPPQLTAFRFQIRTNGGVGGGFYQPIYEKDLFSQLTVGENIIQLDNPITVEGGECLGIWLTNSGGITDSWMSLHEAYGDPRDGMYKYPQSGAGALTLPNIFIHGPNYFPLELFVTEGADVVFIGDSRIEGYSYWSALSYDYFIQQGTPMSILFGRDYDMVTVNMGRSGNNSTDILARFAEDVVAHNPRFAVIGGTQNGTSIPDYEAMVDMCNAANIQAIVLGIMPFAAYDAAIMGVNTALQAAVVPKGAWYIDVQQQLGDPTNNYYTMRPEYRGDDNHQNSVANQVISSALVQLFRQHLPVEVSGNDLKLNLSRALNYDDVFTVDVIGTRIQSVAGISAGNATAFPVVNNIIQSPEPVVFNKLVALSNGYFETTPGSGIWTGEWGLATKRLKAGEDGEMYLKTQGFLSCVTNPYAFRDANQNDYVSVPLVGFNSAGAGGDLYPVQGYQHQRGLHTAQDEYLAIRRVSGVIYLMRSMDAITWTNFFDPTAYTGALYFIGRSWVVNPMLFGSFETFDLP